MPLKLNGFWTTVLLVASAVGLTAQQKPTFSVQIDLVTSDVIARDDKGNFVADLSKDEFQVFEDGVRQEISSMTLIHGGRVTNVLAPPPPPPPEGVILPARRQATDVSGRIFVFFVDDLHLQFQSTSRVRQLFDKISKTLVREGDMFGIVSTGPSSISVDMTYDKRRLEEAIKKMTGSELKPSEIVNGPSGAQGPSEVRHRAHVAFSTANELLSNLEKVHNRRKALVYVSDGYDFNPFQESRLGLMDPTSPFLLSDRARTANQVARDSGEDPANNSATQQQKQGEAFADADLARELGEVTRTANRANTTIYTIDPRGLVGMPDLDEQVDPAQWSAYVRKSQDSLRVMAEETGGIAVVNQNDFDRALKRIDAETSDYYVLGFYSSNPDLQKRRRQIEVRTARKGVDIWSRREYVLKAVLPAANPPAVTTPKK